MDKIEVDIVKENGKTFHRIGNSYTRVHDEKYCGKNTEYRRCEECGKLVSRQWDRSHRYEHQIAESRREMKEYDNNKR